MEEKEKKLEPIFSVSEYIEFLNINLKKIGTAKITGEVTKLTIASSGHVYFSVKDKSGKGVLDCIIWKYNYSLCGVKLEEGKEVILSGYPDIYSASGRFSFKAETVELKGEGALKKAYEELKKKLEKEGLFAEERKRPIPEYPVKIGVITSRQGAVIHDFLNNIGKYGFRIKMIDSRVEGQEAVKDLLASMKTFRKTDIDVLVIIRGGGSLESLMPFNNERLAREVASFPVPVIAGIGHDKDEPLVALAADASKSTPTAVANLLNDSWEQAGLYLERYERKIMGSYDLIFKKYENIENQLKVSLQNFKNTLLNVKIGMEGSLAGHFSGLSAFLSKIKQQLEYAEKAVRFNSPERQLCLGYSIARNKGKIIRGINDVKAGDEIDLKVADGTIYSEVKKINKNI